MKVVHRIAMIVLVLSLMPFAGLAQKTLNLDKRDSQITVTGTSTLHDWEIIVNDFSGMVEGEFNAQKPEIFASKLNVQVQSLKSGKSGMDKNVYEALKEEDHPVITYEFKTTKQIQQSDQGYQITAVGDLTIAGQTKEVEISMTGEFKENKLKVKGSKSFNMSKFEVDPPTVMFGTIKTGDKITVDFSIIYN